MQSAPIVLVPGFWLGAWAWDEVAAPLRADGHEVMALTLPGLESADADRSSITLADHVDAICDAVTAAGPPVVLAVHSGAGAPGYAVTDRSLSDRSDGLRRHRPGGRCARPRLRRFRSHSLRRMSSRPARTSTGSARRSSRRSADGRFPSREPRFATPPSCGTRRVSTSEQGCLHGVHLRGVQGRSWEYPSSRDLGELRSGELYRASGHTRPGSSRAARRSSRDVRDSAPRTRRSATRSPRSSRATTLVQRVLARQQGKQSAPGWPAGGAQKATVARDPHQHLRDTRASRFCASVMTSGDRVTPGRQRCRFVSRAVDVDTEQVEVRTRIVDLQVDVELSGGDCDAADHGPYRHVNRRSD